MAGFTAKPLKLLDGIYRFVGGLGGVNRVDLASDITLVHDVSRQAERAGVGGHFGRINWQETFSPNGTLEEIIKRVNDIGPILGLEEDQYELYVLQVECNMSTADMADITSVSFVAGCESLKTRYGNRIGTSQPMYHVFYWSDTPLSSTNSSGTAKGSIGSNFYPPVWVPPEGFLAIQGVTTAATTLDFSFLLWAGPRGSTPPGMA